MSKKLTTNDLAREVDLSVIRILQLIKNGEIEAEKFGRDWVIDSKYIEIIQNRPERRGRKPIKKAA
jgi:hypothetical protein